MPLFIEELTRLMLEGGAQTVPPTLQQSLAARLDRLGEAREVAQIGAVLGREFSHALMAAVAGMADSSLEAALEKLADADLLFVDGVAPAATYRFKHALIQDAAYDSLLKSRRQALHCRAAEALAASSMPQAEVVAHHFTQGGQTEKAIEWWGKAGDAALRRSSFPEAVAHLGKAIEMANHVPTTQTPKLRSDYRRAVAWSHGQWSDRAAAQDILPETEDAAAHYSEVFIVMARHWGVGDVRAAKFLAEGALRQLKERGAVRWMHSMQRMMAVNHILLGECQAAYVKLKEVTAYFDLTLEDGSAPLGVMDDQTMASSYLMIAAWQVGAVSEALARGRTALARASTLGHLGTAVNHYLQRVILWTEFGDRKTLFRETARFHELAEQSGIPYFLPVARMFRTYAVGLEREPSGAAAELRKQLEEYMAAGARLYAPSIYGRIAELEMLANDGRNVGATIDDGLKIVESGCDLYSSPYLYRLLGIFHARSEAPNLVEADRALRTSIEIASTQGARSVRLLSALALARLPNQSPANLFQARNILLSALEGFESETEFPAVAEALSLLADLNNLPEMKAARERDRQIAEIRSKYRRAVAYGAGHWSDQAAAAIKSGEEEFPPSSEMGAAYYSDVGVLMMRHIGVGDLQGSKVLLEGALRHLLQGRERGKLRWVHWLGLLIGVNHLLLSECQTAYSKLKEVTDFFDFNPDGSDEPLGLMDDQAMASTYLMVAAWQVGSVGEALERRRSAIARASTLGYLGTLVNCYAIRLVVMAGRLDHENLLAEAERFLELASQSGNQFFLPAARMFQLYAVGLVREPRSAAARLRAQLTEYMKAGARIYAPGMFGRIAELEMLADEWLHVNSTIESGIKLVESGCDLYAAPSLYRLLGNFHSRRPDAPNLPEAHRALRTSIDIASSQGARSERLLSALALARLPNQSLDSLSESLNILLSAFEGFKSETEFPAVAEAQSLLTELENAIATAR